MDQDQAEEINAFQRGLWKVKGRRNKPFFLEAVHIFSYAITAESGRKKRVKYAAD